MEAFDLRQERKYCSRIGFALLAALLWMQLWSVLLSVLNWLPAILMALLTGAAPQNGILPDGLYYGLALLGHYAVSLPVGFLLVRCVPFERPARRPLSPVQLLRWFCMGYALLYFGSLLGTGANALICGIAGVPPTAYVSDMMESFPLSVVLLDSCLLGPVCEETVFRYLIAGRLARYGQLPAAFVSALLFGLFHGNVEQFFYAFLLGLLLAYAYFQTGSLLAPCLLHSLINLSGAGLPLLLGEGMGMLALSAVLFCALVAGTALLLYTAARHERVQWAHGPQPPVMRAVFGNPGITLAVVASFVVFAVNFVLFQIAV